MNVDHAPAITGLPDGLLDLSANAVKTYLTIRSFERKVGSGVFPSVATLAKMTDTSERVAWRVIKELKDSGAIVIKARMAANGQTASNRYYFPKILNAQVDGCDTSGTPCHQSQGGMTPVAAEGLTTYLVNTYPDEGHWTGPHYVRSTPASGGSGSNAGDLEGPRPGTRNTVVSEEQPVDTEVESDQDLDHALDSGPEVGPGTSASPRRPGLRGLDRLLAKQIDYKQPLDPDLEQGAKEIVDFFDKLRVQNLGTPPLTPGPRPGQLTSARYMVGFHKHPVTEVLDVIRWIFGNSTGITTAWAASIPKVFVLKERYSEVREAYLADMVSDIGPAPEENSMVQPFANTNPQMDETRSRLADRLMAHR